jgi:sulfhydrogenase subunit alpha
MTRTIAVEHLARIEGHAGITVELDGREMKTVRFDVFEGIRLFEAMVRGRSVEDVPGVVSRICAICSHGHAITALHALEHAMDVPVSAQTKRLRELAFHGSQIESHALHAFCLALPDFLGQASVIELAGVNPGLVATALRLKKLGNTIQEILGGRAVQPVNYVIGGFGRLPSVDDLLRLRTDLQAGLDDCQRVFDALRAVPFPAFADDPIAFAAVVPYDGSYFFGDGIRCTRGGEDRRVADYRAFTMERSVPHSTARHSASDRPYMVGALARLAINGERIRGHARDVWTTLGPHAPLSSIVANDLAQVVELVFSVEKALEIVNGLVEEGIRDERPVAYAPKRGKAAAASEVPRGTLFQEYEIDSHGRIATADVITPTAQNCAHLEEQFRATIRAAGEASDEDLRHRLEIVARAYDPCVSCSVHVIRMG